ncbi:MAG: hypothetical protein Kow0032_14320 [Methyloligellaceae bacterium]
MENALQSLEQLVGGDISAPDPVGPELLERVLELYLMSEGKRSPEDSAVFEAVLERIAYKCSPDARAALANRLAQHPSAPRRLMRRMAFDDIIVSRPVLQYSNRLSDSDLVTLVRKLGEEHQTAIAHRPVLHEIVTDELIQRGSPLVLLTLLRNAGADISEEGRSKLATLVEADEELRAVLSQRPDLAIRPPFFKNLLNFLVGRFLEREDVDKDLADPVAAAVEVFASDKPPAESEEAEAEQSEPAKDADSAGKQAGRKRTAIDRDPPPPEYDSSRYGTSSEHALAEMARVGWVGGSVACLAKLTKIDEAMAQHCLMTADLSALLVLCKAHGFKNATFSALLQLREAKKPDQAPDERIDIIGLLKRYEAMKPHTAKRIIEFADRKHEEDEEAENQKAAG